MNNSVEDDFTKFIGGASVVLALTATLPQIYYSFKTKTAQGCSWWFLLSRLGITILMTIYGIHLGAEMLIFLNIVCMIGGLVMVYYKFVESCNNSEIEEEEEENIL
jgi:MtN3 and saliva related transmembrane protein